jgi:integrase
MAIQFRKGLPLPYRVYWNNPYTKKRQSKSFAEKYEAEKYDALVRFQLQYEKERFLPEEQEPEEKATSITLQDVFYHYLKEKQFSQKGLSWQLDCMKQALIMIGQQAISEVKTSDLTSVLKAHMEKAVKPTTVCARMKVLYTLMRWAVRRGYIDQLPRLPELPENRHEKFIPPNAEEIRRMMAVASSHIQRVIVLGSKLGLRVGVCELFQLRWTDIDLEDGVVHVRAAKKNKAEPIREVPIMSSLLPLMRAWKEMDAQDGMEYVIHHNGKPITRTIDGAWHNMLERAGITRRIRPYDLRHAFASDAIAAGADIGTVARLMGHANVTMTLSYYQHVATKQKKQAVEALPELDHEMLKCACGNVPDRKNSPLQ